MITVLPALKNANKTVQDVNNAISEFKAGFAALN